MAKYLADERRTMLAQMIQEKGGIRNGELADFFGVTTETIRRDLIYLNDKKLVCKTHGGAISISESVERPIHMRNLENADKKLAIAKKALEYIDGSKVVILDSGSTVLQLAQLLSPGQREMLVTNSIPAANVLAQKGLSFFLIGGEFSPITMATSGMTATQSLNMIKADVVFLGTSGFQACNGPSAKAFCDAQVKSDMISNSRTRIVLADSGKFVTNAFVRFSNWSEIDYLITDADAPADKVEELRHMVEIVIA